MCSAYLVVCVCVWNCNHTNDFTCISKQSKLICKIIIITNIRRIQERERETYTQITFGVCAYIVQCISEVFAIHYYLFCFQIRNKIKNEHYADRCGLCILSNKHRGAVNGLLKKCINSFVTHDKVKGPAISEYFVIEILNERSNNNTIDKQNKRKTKQKCK